MVRLKVKEVAETQGITSAAELARRTGLAFAKANELWKGEITTDGKRSVGVLTLHRVAKALGVKIADLLEEDRAALLPAAA
ncbi:MAG TPA: helix-turn-helix transcriptional regulator [Chloroflexaceae bacterium]|nr:helix-turn-helix transcriptional regulator [Chloroflexaceae bacterium]